MKRSRKVFEMNEHELRSTLCTLTPEGDYLGLTKSDMQEELIYWLLLHGLTASHQFLLYEDEDGVVWLLDRGRDGCPCCRTPSINTNTNLARPYDDSQGRTSRSSNTPLDVVIYRKSSESTFPV
uniref:Ras-associating domain-containing protein n=1 Tax=Panagrellus redivivus TaxID=6233 RepID=A0A7E4W8Y8_PANRE